MGGAIMTKNTPPITASEIKRLLARKHARDVFVAECKNGPTWNVTGLGILDAWAMKRSYANLCMWGYEIKVTRSDFVRDDKWQGYLHCCNQFYFVTPSGLLDPNEVPQEAGLMCCSKTGTRLYVKKKAPHRAVELPANLFQYLLFSRTRIDADRRDSAKPDSREYWTRWLEQRTIDRELGLRVRATLSRTIRERIIGIDDTQRRLDERLSRLEGVEEAMREMGLSPWYDNATSVRLRAKQLSQVIPPAFVRAVQDILRTSRVCQAAIDKYMKPDVKPREETGA